VSDGGVADRRVEQRDLTFGATGSGGVDLDQHIGTDLLVPHLVAGGERSLSNEGEDARDDAREVHDVIAAIIEVGDHVAHTYGGVRNRLVPNLSFPAPPVRLSLSAWPKSWSLPQEFRRESFVYRSEDDLKDKRLNRFLTVDLAFSDKETADNIGFCDNRVDPTNRWNLRAWGRKLSPKDFIDYLFVLHQECNFTGTVYMIATIAILVSFGGATTITDVTQPVTKLDLSHERIVPVLLLMGLGLVLFTAGVAMSSAFHRLTGDVRDFAKYEAGLAKRFGRDFLAEARNSFRTSLEAVDRVEIEGPRPSGRRKTGEKGPAE
jgi:hypothetical protein